MSTAYKRGLKSEEIVIQELESKRYQLLFRRKKIWGVEFDLIFEKDDVKYLIEVKSLGPRSSLENRWPWRQKSRFYKVAQIISENPKYNAQFKLAVVHANSKIDFYSFEEIFG